MVAAVVGFLALLRSQVPMIQDFGLLLSLGVAVLVAVALTVPVSVLVRRDRRRPDGPARTGQRALELPLLGYVAAGLPIEAVATDQTIAVPEDLARKRELAAGLRRDGRYRALLQIWLWVHVPLTSALLVTMIAHVVLVFFYW